jgi:5'-methylthioadenosine phosphorylase
VPWKTERVSTANETGTPIGVIGGSGLYGLLDDGSGTSVTVETPYGPPSSEITVGTFAGRSVAFLPRHGKGHTVAPHQINYRANVWALASLGVKAIITSSAVGGLNPELPPGTFVLPDQIIDRTAGRRDTYFDGSSVQHVALADPYCPELRRFAAAALSVAGETFVSHGTTVVIQGPRFSTRAEARWFRSAGADIVNMTQYPEVSLAAELNVGLVNLSFITDSDTGDGSSSDRAGADDVNAQLVFDRMAEAGPRLLAMIGAIVAGIPEGYTARQLVPREAVDAVLAAKPTA